MSCDSDVRVTNNNPTTDETVSGSSILRLPGELRNRIYFHILGGHVLRILPPASPNKASSIKNAGVIIVTPEWASTKDLISLHECLDLLLVCKQVYDEAKLLPVEWNVFEIQDVRLFAVWVKECLCQWQRDAMRMVYCRRNEAYMMGKINVVPIDAGGTYDDHEPLPSLASEAVSLGDLSCLSNLKRVCLTGPRTGGFFPRGWERVCVRGVKMMAGKEDVEVGFEGEENWLGIQRDEKTGQRPEGD